MGFRGARPGGDGSLKRAGGAVSHACAVLALLLLGGCATEGRWWFFDAPNYQSSEDAELGFAEMAKGNYAIAENHFQKALRTNPKDIHALLGAGILYQNTGQLAKAREMYEMILALKPGDAQQFIVLNNLSTRPISQIAASNLAMIEGGGQAEGMLQGMAGQPPRPGAALRPMTPGTSAPAPTIVPSSPSRPGGQPPMMAMPAAAQMAPPSPRFVEGDANVASRFATLRALRDQGLMTPDEFGARRQANIGALVPLSAPPPAAGLDRPVPPTDQIVGRLRAIARALETRAISVTQHAGERTIILDALMPAAPSVVANPGVPPRGLMDAADSVRRLEQFREAGMLTADEYARERQAIDAAIQPPPPPPPPKVPVPVAAAAPEPAKTKAAGPQAAVHLASYRSQKEADRGWAQVRRAHQEVLGKLEHEIAKVELGGKGTFYRLMAGPLASKDAAAELCGKLKARRQFCEPAVMGAS